MKSSQLGNKIKNLRMEAGVSQEELAIKSQLSLRTIQRIENGETVPRGDSLKKISEALGFPISHLIGTTLKEDKGILILLSLSALSFLIFPLLGIILPMILWLTYKDKILGIKETGRKIIKSQVYWLTIFLIVYLYIFGLKIFDLSEPFSINLKIVIVGLYLYNLIIISLIITGVIKDKQRNFHGAVTPLL